MTIDQERDISHLGKLHDPRSAFSDLRYATDSVGTGIGEDGLDGQF
jgi:hypothetical protein